MAPGEEPKGASARLCSGARASGDAESEPAGADAGSGEEGRIVGRRGVEGEEGKGGGAGGGAGGGSADSGRPGLSRKGGVRREEGGTRGGGAADAGRGRGGGLWAAAAAARSDTASRGEDERAPRPQLPAQPAPPPSLPRPLGAPAAPGAAMAPALWRRLSRVLWLACLLPLAPAGVAAGKALRPPLGLGAVSGGLASRQPRPWRWRRAPCAHLLPPERPLQRAAEESVAKRPLEALSSYSPPFSPDVGPALEGAPGAPRFPLPPPDRPCPGNRARWPVHPCGCLGAS